MCLHAVGTLQTATKDIPVWKILRKDNKSLLQNFQYEPNTLYRLRKALEVDWGNTIEAGYHSFNPEQLQVYREERGSAYWRVAPRPDYDFLSRRLRGKLVRFYIPKGAKYYLGNRGDIVSTSLHSGSLTAARAKK
jgi:hypothetical protein